MSVADELKKLAKLKDTGILTAEEFNTQKVKLLKSGPPYRALAADTQPGQSSDQLGNVRSLPEVSVIALSCPKCGGSLKIDRGVELFKCEYCGTPALVRTASPIGAEVSTQETRPAFKAVEIVSEFSAPANLWRGRFLWIFPNAQGGKVVLTDRELVFLPHLFNAGSLKKCSMPIIEIMSVERSGSRFTVVRNSGESMELVTWQGKGLKAAILAAQQRLNKNTYRSKGSP